ncbi:MAG: Hemerythrin cation binding domain protein [Acidimicrobiales bacterium]|nr:Hemerythrin cation binding domain protein [Acidimicrobiales bacterium]
MEPTPDLTPYFAIHRKQLVDTRRYARAVEQATEHERSDRLRSLARWAAGFAHELDEHHTVEDAIFFPDVRSRVPSAAAVLDGLEEDHVVVEDLLGRWTQVAADLADAKVPFAPAKAAALAVATGLRDLLDQHLEVEDRDLLPLFWRHYTASEYDALHDQAVKGGNKQGLAFTIPWYMAAQDAEHQAMIAARSPLPVRVLWYATRGRFARLEQAAFADVEVDLSDLRPVVPQPASSRR